MLRFHDKFLQKVAIANELDSKEMDKYEHGISGNISHS
jgi:hypothetical protein